MEKVIWNGIEIFGYDYKRIISYLETLDKEYIDNLVQCTAQKGYCQFVWKFKSKKHVTGYGIDIPDGDYWGYENEFIEVNKDFEQFILNLKMFIKTAEYVKTMNYHSLSNHLSEFMNEFKNIPR